MIFELIKEIHEHKAGENIHPNHVLFMELYRKCDLTTHELKTEVKNLILDGLITWGHTINDIYLIINNNGKSKD